MIPWSADHIADLVKNYAEERTADIAVRLGRSPGAVRVMAHVHRIKKTRRRTGNSTTWRRGHKAWHAGQKLAPGRMTSTSQYKPGNVPVNILPAGTVVHRGDGYLWKKISDNNADCKKNWRLVHVLLWEQHNGPLPDGMIVIFKNRNKTDIRIANLIAITAAEKMLRNSIHNFTPEVREVHKARARLTVAIKRLLNHEK